MGGKKSIYSTIHFLSGYLSDAHLENKPWVFGGRLNYALIVTALTLNERETSSVTSSRIALKREQNQTSHVCEMESVPAKTNRCTMPRNRCRDLALGNEFQRALKLLFFINPCHRRRRCRTPKVYFSSIMTRRR